MIYVILTLIAVAILIAWLVAKGELSEARIENARMTHKIEALSIELKEKEKEAAKWKDIGEEITAKAQDSITVLGNKIDIVEGSGRSREILHRSVFGVEKVKALNYDYLYNQFIKNLSVKPEPKKEKEPIGASWKPKVSDKRSTKAIHSVFGSKSSSSSSTTNRKKRSSSSSRSTYTNDYTPYSPSYTSYDDCSSNSHHHDSGSSSSYDSGSSGSDGGGGGCD